MNYMEKARTIPVEDRPVPKNQLSGLSNFFGLYGGEHIAATEFVIGATLVTFGVKASEIFLGLFIGNLLAMFTYALLCAPIAVDTRLTLYSYLGKVLGKPIQKVYNFVWGLCSIAMAASMLTVSASAVREILHIRIQTEWYPTDIKFVAMVIILGVIVTVVAANGFEAVAKFSGICAPWMIVIFLAGFAVVVPELLQATGAPAIHSFGDFMNTMNTYVWNGTVPNGGTKLSIYHVIAFAWMCNLAYHGGLNDMSLFRYAKNRRYGYVTAYGMYVGHFFAWGSAGVMGAAASILLNTPLAGLDSGAITAVTLGRVGLLAVIIAGWTTANPSIYRATLSFQSAFNVQNYKKLTYIVGAVMTVAACFPIMSQVMTIVNIIVLVVPAVGAIVLTEHWIIPKVGGTRYWAMYKGWKMNYAGLIAWLISLGFVIVMKMTGVIHSYFLFLPTYLIAIAAYLILALLMGAKGDYTAQVEEDRQVAKALEALQETEGEAEPVKVPKHPAIQKAMAWTSYVVLAAFAVFTCLVPFGIVTVAMYQAYALLFTLLYFAFGGVSVFLKYGNTSIQNNM